MSWGHFPPSWVLQDRGLTWFTAGASTGVHIAALKCYLAIASVLDFHSKSVAISVTDLMEVTSCSRPMVIAGLKALAERGLVAVDTRARRHRYTLLGFDEGPKPAFRKVPESVKDALRNLPNRGETALSAVKILVLLLTLRDGPTNHSRVGHEKIRDYCGMQTRYVRPGVDHLVNHRVIHVAEGEGGGSGRSFNVYTILGVFNGGRQDGPGPNPFEVARQPVPTAPHTEILNPNLIP